jgi:hypothetical protein
MEVFHEIRLRLHSSPRQATQRRSTFHPRQRRNLPGQTVRANEDTNPPRIAPRHLFDFSVGTDNLLRPRHVWLRQTEEGANDSLEIVEEGNQKTLLRFRSPMLPELVDGVV